MTTPVIVKFPTETRAVNIDFVNDLLAGESITAVMAGTPSPAGLAASVAAAVGTAVPLTVSGGADLQSYGVDVTVNTDQGHTYNIKVAIVNNSNLAANYQNVNVDAFNALVGELTAGEAALGQAAFMFPAGFDASGGQVKWEIVDTDGIVLGNGNAYDYQVNTLSQGVKVEAKAVVSVPSDALPTLSGQNYQIRWSLIAQGQTFYSFEALKVNGPNTVPEGVDDVVELAGHDVPVSAVFAQPFDNVTVTVYRDNHAVSNPIPVSAGIKTSDGWLYQVELTGLELQARLEAYMLVWAGKNLNSNYTERQTGRMFIVSPTMLAATDDMRLILNRSRATIAHAQDLMFTVPLLLAYLRRGCDAFNAAYGVPTDFSMTAATGALREYWLRFSEIQALRGQYLAEGEKAFNYSGAQVQLDVDRAQYYEQAASQLQQLLDNECKPFKVMLIKRGYLGGDGNIGNLTKQNRGAAGALSITLSPATNFGPYARYRR